MRTLTMMAVTSALVVLFSPAAPDAQGGSRWRGSGGWGPGGGYGRMYDPKTVETVRGEVLAVEELTPLSGMGRGVHLTLGTEKGPISVHLGPAWYVEHQDTTIASHDTVEVMGSRVELQGKPAIIAAEVRKGDEILLLRDASGVPLWSGARRRGPTPAER